MFERFTDRSRRVLVLANETAKANHNEHITELHLLAGLCEAGGLAGKVLNEAGVTADTIVAAMSPEGEPTFTPAVKRILERALSEALQLGHNYIGTEHMLLAINRPEDAPHAARYLLGLKIRERVLDAVGLNPGPGDPGIPDP